MERVPSEEHNVGDLIGECMLLIAQLSVPDLLEEKCQLQARFMQPQRLESGTSKPTTPLRGNWEVLPGGRE